MRIPSSSPAALSASIQLGQYLHSDHITFDGPHGAVVMEMENTGLAGFGFAGHLHSNLSARLEFMFGGTTLSGDIPGKAGPTPAIDPDTIFHTGRLNRDGNILTRPLTPFLTVDYSKARDLTTQVDAVCRLEWKFSTSAPHRRCLRNSWLAGC